MAYLGDSANRRQGARLVVRMHDGNKRHPGAGLAVKRPGDVLSRDGAEPAGLQHMHGPAERLQGFPGTKHRFVLGGTGQHTAGCGPKRHVVGLRAPARKNNFSRFGAQKSRHLLAAFLDRESRLPAQGMHRRGIAELLPEERLHGLEHARVKRRRGGMIEVDGMHNAGGSWAPGWNMSKYPFTESDS